MKLQLPDAQPRAAPNDRSPLPWRLLRRLGVALILLAVHAVHAQLLAGPTALKGRLAIGGSHTMLPLVIDIARRFEGVHPAVRIEVMGGGSGKGVIDLRAGSIDLAMMSRGLIDSERGLYSFPIARDGIAVVVHRDNPVKSLNKRQLGDLLTGRIATWKVLGGRAAPVHIAWRGKGQGSSELVLEHLNLQHEQIGRHTLMISNTDAIKFVAGDPDAVTVVSLGESERSARAGVAIKLLPYNGVQASSRTVANQTYALTRPLTLVSRGLPAGLHKQFIDYALSSHVADLHLKHDFIPYRE
jgi:phosphate transport system substrate-binding protein